MSPATNSLAWTGGDPIEDLDRFAAEDAAELDPFTCRECGAPETIVDEFDDQIGFEEQARSVHVVILACGHELVTPAR